MRILSLGAGVQSTVLALMAAHGEIEPPAHAIFADTGWEPNGVYRHLEWLESTLPFPVHRVSIGHRLQDQVRKGVGYDGKHHFIDTPKFIRQPDGSRAFANIRQCTRAYKVQPIRRKIREIIGYPGKTYIPRHVRIIQLFGISLDEATRMRDSDAKFIIHEYPLIDRRMTRDDCMTWWDRNYPGRNLSKSSCVGCPFHSRREWVRLRTEEPEQFEETCEIDEAIRHIAMPNATAYLHFSATPLRQAVEIDAIHLEEKDRMQALADSQLSLWDAECSGYCGV